MRYYTCHSTLCHHSDPGAIFFKDIRKQSQFLLWSFYLFFFFWYCSLMEIRDTCVRNTFVQLLIWLGRKWIKCASWWFIYWSEEWIGGCLCLQHLFFFVWHIELSPKEKKINLLLEFWFIWLRLPVLTFQVDHEARDHKTMKFMVNCEAYDHEAVSILLGGLCDWIMNQLCAEIMLSHQPLPKIQQSYFSLLKWVKFF